MRNCQIDKVIDIREIVTDLIKLTYIKSDVEFIYDLRTKKKNNQLRKYIRYIDINILINIIKILKAMGYYKIINLKNQKTTGVVEF